MLLIRHGPRWGLVLIGLDANVLIRWLIEDDSSPDQTEKIRDRIRIASGEVYINLVVLAETTWVLGHIYRQSRATIASAYRGLLAHPKVKVADRALVETALTAYELGNSGFVDHLIGTLNTAAGCKTTLTFDKSAAKGPHFTQLS